MFSKHWEVVAEAAAGVVWAWLEVDWAWLDSKEEAEPLAEQLLLKAHESQPRVLVIQQRMTIRIL